MDKICTQDNKNRANFHLLTKVFFIMCNAFMILLFKKKKKKNAFIELLEFIYLFIYCYRTLGKYMHNINNKAFLPKLWGQLWILNRLMRD